MKSALTEGNIIVSATEKANMRYISPDVFDGFNGFWNDDNAETRAFW